MQNLKDIREAFKAYRKSEEKEEAIGLNLDVLLEDSTVTGVLAHVLATLKVEDTFSN
jgi:hypothetical protein